MKLWKLVGLSSALAAGALSLAAQEATPAALGKQLEELLRVQKQQAEQIESLKKQIEILKGQPAYPGAKSVTLEPKVEELQQRVDALTESSKKAFAGQFNPAFGFVGETVFGYRSTGSDKNGGPRPGGFDANLRSGELTLQAAIDPFAKGYLVVNGSADTKGEAALGIEEAALITTALPGNLTVRAGRFFADFGRLSFRHDHELPFVNRPLVLDNFIGGESRADGLEVNWLLPTSHYINLAAGVGTQLGSAAVANPGTFRTANELTFWTHLSSFWELTPNFTLEGGVSGLLTDRTDSRGGALVQADGSTLTEKRRKVAGTDLTLRYQPLDAAAYRGFEWGTELLFNQGDFLFDPNGSLDPAKPAPALSGDEFRGRVNTMGLYSYLAAKIDREWTAGFLFDWVQNLPGVAVAPYAQPDTFRYSPYLTWKPSETQMLRLQYSFTDERRASGRADDHAVYLQWIYVLGSHSHGFRDR